MTAPARPRPTAPRGEMAAPTVEQLTNMILTALSLAGVSYSTEQRKALAGLLSATKALWDAALRERIRVLEEAGREVERISMATTGAGTMAERLDRIYEVARAALAAEGE